MHRWQTSLGQITWIRGWLACFCCSSLLQPIQGYRDMVSASSSPTRSERAPMSEALMDMSVDVPSPPAPNDPPADLRLVHSWCCVCNDDNAVPCGIGEDFEYRTSRDSFVAMRCQGCGLIYLSPRPDVSEL